MKTLFAILFLVASTTAQNCATWGPPTYMCSSRSTAVVQTPLLAPFSGTTGYNQVNYDLALNPGKVNPITRVTDSSMLGGNTPSSTPTGGDEDLIFNCKGRPDLSAACGGFGYYLQQVVYNGCPYVGALKVVGGVLQVVGPWPPSLTGSQYQPSPCGSMEFSLGDPQTAYMLKGTGDPVIYKLVYTWDGTVGHVPTFTQSAYFDVGANCPLPNGTSYNATYSGPVFPSKGDNIFTFETSAIIGLANGADTITVTNGLANFTLNGGGYSMATDGSLVNAPIVINGLTTPANFGPYTIASVTDATHGTIAPAYTSAASGTYSVSIPSGQNTAFLVVQIQISPAACAVTNVFTGAVVASGAWTGGTLASSCRGMHIHDGFNMIDGVYSEWSGATTGTNCGNTYMFLQNGTLNQVPCTGNVTTGSYGSICSGHSAGGYHNEYVINNPVYLNFAPENAQSNQAYFGAVPPLAFSTLNCETHFSARNQVSGDAYPVFISTAQNNYSTSGTVSTWASPSQNEVVALTATGAMPRFMHNFILGPGNSAGCGNSNVGPFDDPAYFRAGQAIGGVSDDGAVWGGSSSMLGQLGLDALSKTRADIFDVLLDGYNPAASTPAVASF